MPTRNYGTTLNGSGFNALIKRAVWEKASFVNGQDTNIIRQDACGAWIYWDQYGVTAERGYGWEIDHIQPVAHEGTDDFSNLQALQWQNNRSKSDNITGWSCAIRHS